MPQKPMYRRHKRTARGHIFRFLRLIVADDSSSNMFGHIADTQGSREPREVVTDGCIFESHLSCILRCCSY